MLAIFEHDPKPWEQHRRAVAALRKTIKRNGRLRQSNSSYPQQAVYDAPGDIPRLDSIVQLDPDTRTAWVESNVTMENLVRATLKCGLVPAVVAASKGTSVADAFAATTTESSSFSFGTFDCTVLSMEAILSNGEYVLARSDDHSTADLLFGSAGAMHSLGLTTLLEIALIPAGEFVEVAYLPVFSVSGARRKMQQLNRDPCVPRSSVLDSADFVEGIMFNSSSGIVMTGRFTPTANRIPILKSHTGNSFTRHARSVWQDSQFAHKQRVDVFPTMEYLFRHDDRRSCIGARSKRLSSCQKSSRNLAGESHSLALQDIGLPVEATEEYIHGFHVTQGIWPIWIYPVTPPNTFGRCSFGIGASFEYMFWNLRFYSSSAACNGTMERRLGNAHGFRYLHCRARCSEETVWVFHDDRWYGKLRSRWNAQGFPDVSARLRTSRPLACI